MAETNITGPLWGFEHRSRRLGGLWPITFYALSYTLTPAANNINEGSALTINVSGTGIPDGTYYWTIDSNAGDFATSSGSFTITSNSGSFTVTPAADSTTEGAETFTLSIRSGSTSGTILATTSSLTINDTSVAVPPAVLGAWFAGGTPSTTAVSRITYASDTSSPSLRGSLGFPRTQHAASGNANYGWHAGGSYGSSIERITLADDTSTASLRGYFSITGRYTVRAAGTATDGWFAGGGFPGVSSVERLTYATDTTTPSLRGPLSFATTIHAATGNSTYGWFAGGRSAETLVSRITYTSDTGTAATRGSLNIGGEALTGVGNSNDGWFAGGYMPGIARVSTIRRITYASDTSSSSSRTQMAQAWPSNYTAAGDADYGWFGGGYYTTGPYSGPSGEISSLQRLTYANDTSQPSVRAAFSYAFSSAGANSSV